MKVLTMITVLALIGAAPNASAFSVLSLINKVNPSVQKYAEAQDSALLKIHLDIGATEYKKGVATGTGGHRLGIDGMLLELRGNEVADCKHPKLPGAQGPNPQLSSGAKALSVLRKGKFVDITGSHHVSMDNGAWEMIWRRSASAGKLICGFDVREEVKRNDASLPAGRVYVTFPVWTTDSLEDMRGLKIKAEEKAIEAIARQKDEVRQMRETDNLLMKALHFRNACKASEDLDYSGHQVYSKMPLDRDMVELDEGLRLCTLGTVWTEKGHLFGGDRVLLGSARVSPGTRGELNEKKVVTERELKSVAFDGLRP